MNLKTIDVKQSDGHITKVYHYECQNETLGSLLFLHGMAEHVARYHYFAEYMTERGYDIYLYSHRGHGKETNFEDLGYFEDNNGYTKVIHDALTIAEYIRTHQKPAKLYLMGHSMGSVIARNVVQFDDSFDGVIYCATTHPNKLKSYMGLLLASFIRRQKGARHRSVLMNKLLFGSKHYKRICNDTDFDWLSRDGQVVREYMADHYCGFLCTIAFYIDLIKLTICASNKRYICRTIKDLPIYIIAGSKDPVGSCGTEIRKLTKLHHSLGFKNVNTVIYPDCRHELINEYNKEEVMAQLIEWINSSNG